jgi:hypothetical protein
MAIDNFMALRREQFAHELATIPGTLEKLYAKRNYRRVGHLVDTMARVHLQRGMIAARLEGDFQSARTDFSQAAALTLEFERALEGIGQGDAEPVPPTFFGCLDIEDFENPLLMCALAHDWPRAEAVARITRDPRVRDLEDPVHSLMVRMLAALVLDDAAAFAVLKSAYDKRKKSAWMKYFVHYVDMYEAVINRDQARYNELALTADQLYRARARDRKLGDLRPEYGGLRDNEHMLDFMALAIAIVAVKRGMCAGKESDIVPAELIIAFS